MAVFQNIAASHNKFSPVGSYLTHASTCPLASVITAIGSMIFTFTINLRRLLRIIREVVMIERELGNWKDFIEVMLRK